MKKALFLLPLVLALAGFSTASRAQEAKAGDAAKGANKAAMFIGCHGIVGYQASFPEVYKVPMIAGQGAKYIASALTAYQKGDRKHPTMRGIAAPLTEQDMADLGAFYEAQGKGAGGTPAPTALASPVPDALKDRMAACVACHGANFSKPIDPSYPKLAGQHADYLAVTLHAYSVTGNPQVGRSNAIMAGQVKQFSRADLKALAKYIGSLPGELATVPQSRFR